MRIDEIKTQLKVDYPTLKCGSEEFGYEEIVGQDYENTINQWAEDIYTEELKAQAEAEAAAKKAAAEAKLAALGLTADDLKALGLGGN